MQRPIDYPNTPTNLWNKFYEITQVPRPSKKEEKIRDYLVNIAKSEGMTFRVDDVGNVVIYVPGRNGLENKDAVIIQNHMDMVCDKTPERNFDFENDSIELFVKDGWIYALDTTLGADNGFGCAAALALIYEKDIAHPPLELLFTVDEETGLNGASNLDRSLFKGTRMINLDTEDWGVIYIGCAGGVDWQFNGKSKMSYPAIDLTPVKIEVSNLKGGHSGLDIHKGRGNAIKILNEVLWDMRNTSYELVKIIGGKAHNIIPRDASAVILINDSHRENLEKIISRTLLEFKSTCREEDNNIEIELVDYDKEINEVFTRKERDRIINLINLFPHGACNYDWKIKGPLVSYSSSFAMVKMEKGSIFVETSLRFIDLAEIRGLEQKLEGIAHNFDLKYVRNGGYPSWKPNHNNDLLELVKTEYKEMFNKSPEVKAIHAGLECGILLDKLDKLDVISIGPNITGAHSPTERLEISSSNEFWNFLTRVLSRL